MLAGERERERERERKRERERERQREKEAMARFVEERMDNNLAYHLEQVCMCV